MTLNAKQKRFIQSYKNCDILPITNYNEMVGECKPRSSGDIKRLVRNSSLTNVTNREIVEHAKRIIETNNGQRDEYLFKLLSVFDDRIYIKFCEAFKININKTIHLLFHNDFYQEFNFGRTAELYNNNFLKIYSELNLTKGVWKPKTLKTFIESNNRYYKYFLWFRTKPIYAYNGNVGRKEVSTLDLGEFDMFIFFGSKSKDGMRTQTSVFKISGLEKSYHYDSYEEDQCEQEDIGLIHPCVNEIDICGDEEYIAEEMANNPLCYGNFKEGQTIINLYDLVKAIPKVLFGQQEGPHVQPDEFEDTKNKIFTLTQYNNLFKMQKRINRHDNAEISSGGITSFISYMINKKEEEVQDGKKKKQG